MVNMSMKLTGIFLIILLERAGYEGKSLDVKGFYALSSLAILL